MSFTTLPLVEADPLLSLTTRFMADPRKAKIDLGVGVYRDIAGRTPVFAAVKHAEQQLVNAQASKSYLGPDGNREFVERLALASLGRDADVGGLQTIGGTGALFLAAQLLVRTGLSRRIWIAWPSWSNHEPIFQSCGLTVNRVSVIPEGGRDARAETFFDALQRAQPGDAVLIQGCCNNPTGQDYTAGQWRQLTQIISAGHLVPLIDIAYQGFGDGWHDDLDGVRQLMKAVPETLIAYSCSKNFGLYRERVGALFVSAASRRTLDAMLGHLSGYARSTYSMPADHGAAVVTTILSDPHLQELWSSELKAMRERLVAVREALSRSGRVGVCDLTPLAGERGMFTQLNLSATIINCLSSNFGIYLANSGRINLAGLNDDNLGTFVGALAEAQRQFG
jgi:aromatic-amino-acid transaminase